MTPRPRGGRISSWPCELASPGAHRGGNTGCGEGGCPLGDMKREGCRGAEGPRRLCVRLVGGRAGLACTPCARHTVHAYRGQDMCLLAGERGRARGPACVRHIAERIGGD